LAAAACVALKILPASFTGDPERVARFRREAQVLAALKHPNIAQIYGREESDGKQFIELELVDGESLDQRIARRPIPLDEALRDGEAGGGASICKQFFTSLRRSASFSHRTRFHDLLI
jgi:serine/threonine protein kinase